MLIRANQRRVLRMTRTGRISGVWLGTPCTSLTRARHGKSGKGGWSPPLRSKEFPNGLSDLNDKHPQKVFEGNTLIQCSVQVIKLCVRLKIPVAVENPCTRFFWWTSWMSELRKQHPPSARNSDLYSWKNVGVRGQSCGVGI